MTLHVDAAVRLGDFDLRAELVAPAGQVTAVLGPSGSGKTTLLRAIWGSVPIDAGTIRIDDRVLDSPPGTFVVPEERHVGVVFQDYLLFPHLTALENVAFGPRARGWSARDARAAAAALLERVGVGSQAGLKPRSLSGGQAQRVALARALATEPDLLLLDEPLAALDVATRVEVRRDLRRYLADFAGPAILVTHDPVDALALADRVVIIEAGRVTQEGTLAEVTSRPRTPYVAELLGVNLLVGSGVGHAVELDGASVATAQPVEGPTLVLIRPSSVALHLHQPDSSARNQWSMRIGELNLLGERVRVRLVGPFDLVAEVTPEAVAALGLVEGGSVWASVKATDVTAYRA